MRQPGLPSFKDRSLPCQSPPDGRWASLVCSSFPFSVWQPVPETSEGTMKLTNIIAVFFALALTRLSVTRAEPAEPIPAQSRIILTNGAIYFKDRSITPPAFGPKSLLQSPAPSTNFPGLEGSGFTPDTHGAAGRGTLP